MDISTQLENKELQMHVLQEIVAEVSKTGNYTMALDMMAGMEPDFQEKGLKIVAREMIATKNYDQALAIVNNIKDNSTLYTAIAKSYSEDGNYCEALEMLNRATVYPAKIMAFWEIIENIK